MKKTSSFPWSHVIGFIGSIVLTFLAIGVAVRSPLSMVGTLTVLLVLAALQILIQLVFFMHINEKKGRLIIPSPFRWDLCLRLP